MKLVQQIGRTPVTVLHTVKWICWLLVFVMKQTPNHQVAGSADCRVDAFEMNRTCRTKFMINIRSVTLRN